MRDDVRQIWTAALRSGEYKQAHGTLCRINNGIRSYCCLGVLCELAMKNGVEVTKVEREGLTYYNEEGSILPQAVADWAGLKSLNPGIGEPTDEDRYEGLACLNDGGFYFSQIADLIDWEYAGVPADV